MRQLLVQVPDGHGEEAAAIAERHGSLNTARFHATNEAGAAELVFVHVENARVGPLLDDLEDLPEARVSFSPQSVLALRPPPEETPAQVVDVDRRSPVEVYLAGLSSIGSWGAYLGYSALAAVVVWIGLITNREFLLVAAMLIAPFGGPAINAAVGTARGDLGLLARSVGRYVAGITLVVAGSAALSLAVGQEVETTLLTETGQVSATALLLPLAAGAVGALHLVQSQRASLVSGAATGLLVAAALAPPAGAAGMAAAMGMWAMAGNAAFLLVLQLIGINLTAALLFRAFGLNDTGIRFTRGQPRVFPVALAVTVLVLAGLLAVQAIPETGLQRESDAQQARADMGEMIEATGVADLVEADVRYTERGPGGRRTLLATVYVSVDDPGDADAVESDLAGRAEATLQESDPDSVPLVEVTALTPDP